MNSEPNSDLVILPEATWKSGEVVPVSHLSPYPLGHLSRELVCCAIMKDKCDIHHIYDKKTYELL